ncbi:MAG: DUF2865 domain-containing protein [Pseudomonadota bacterium]
MSRTLDVLHAASPYLVLSVATVVLFATGANQPAAAQGLFQQLFGAPKPKPRVIQRKRPRRSRGPVRLRQPTGPSFGSLFSVPATRQPKPQRRYSPRYRTVCVRMCDGYYFPVSFSTRRNRLRRDARVCDNRCPGQGRLFYMRSPRGTIEDAVDLQGRKYKKLDVALRYRKKLVPNCACRPAPWSPQERLRHAMYRGDDSEAATGGTSVVAGKYPTAQSASLAGQQTRVQAGVVIAGGIRLRASVLDGLRSAPRAPDDGHPLALPPVSDRVAGTHDRDTTADAERDLSNSSAARARSRREARGRARGDRGTRQHVRRLSTPTKKRRQPRRKQKPTASLFGTQSSLRFPGD